MRLWEKRYHLTDFFAYIEPKPTADYEAFFSDEVVNDFGKIYAEMTGDSQLLAECAAWEAEHAAMLLSSGYRAWKQARQAYWKTPEGRREAQQIHKDIEECEARIRQRQTAEEAS